MVHPRLQHALRSSLLAASSRRPATCARSSSTLAPHVTSYTPPTISEDNFIQNRIRALRRALVATDDPSRIWAHYTNFVNYFKYDALPLEIHRKVLRQCSIPPQALRVLAARHLLEGRKPEAPHMHEGRFQTVIRNIRALGHTPSLEDYHYILEQFAAVGHYVGSLQVYQEIIHLGLTPEPKTIGLFLQAVAHRLCLPILRAYRPRLTSQTRKILDELMSDMRKYNIPFTQYILDLALRIFKETVDKEGFDTLVKFAYGIDLSNPDCPPLEFLEGQSQSQPPTVIPLSTHALNTIIDTLGRFGDISRLIQAFEVLTQPLPQASQHLFSSFDDEEDFGVSVQVPSPPNFTLPFAEPNTTTYNMLLRHIGQANHAVLARHYIIQALRLDRQVNWDLGSQLKGGVPIEEIQAPQFSLNRKMLLSVFGHANRRKNLGLMRWLSEKLPKIQRFKRKDLEFYTEFQDRLGASPEPSEMDADAETVPPLPSDDFKTILPTLVQAPVAPSRKISFDAKNLGKAFDININDQSLPELPPPKMLDLDLHIRILTEDIKEISSFAKDLDDVLGRTFQRRKERLGRRVWRGQDIYLSDNDRREGISRTRWREIVHFRPRRALLRRGESIRTPFTKDIAPHLVQPDPQSQRSFSTHAGATADNETPSQLSTLVSKIRSLVSS
ncbi:hypothetical protein D9756_000868 [Leucocoprinus leucothites]|uniref:Uncharacterized protein n=1 Tax=Leucocoprinus leucothites TaxID=201217 RepID=A0A8H5LNT6_9AGAR|nr:hypothetical protein D9756_000868 [Leucoagaricus leucothites]